MHLWRMGSVLIVVLYFSSDAATGVVLMTAVGNLWFPQSDGTPLFVAAQAGHLEVCQWLVTECGCDASVKDDVSL